MTLHIATSHTIGGVIARAVHAPVRYVTENLLLGPSAADPEEHAELRLAFWDLRGRDRTRFRAAFRDLREAIHASERLVLWTTSSLSDAAALSWLCAWRSQSRPPQPGLDIVRLGPDPGAAAWLDRITIHVKGADIRRALDDVRPLSPARMERIARGWRRLTRSSPVSLPARGGAGEERRDLADLAAYQAGLFPRIEGSRLALSRFDALLFACLGDEARTPVDVFVHKSRAGEELRRWMYHTGDLFLARRLSQWAEHGGPEAALESEPVRPENTMLEARYRLSRAGKAMRRRGLAAMDEAPPIPIFGAVAYDPRAPWVVTGEDAAGPRFERIDRPRAT